MLMPNRSTVVALLVVLMGAGVPRLLAQAPTTPEEEAEHDALRGLRAIYEQAVNENRVDLLQPLLHPEFTGVMMTGRQVTSFDEVTQYWQDIRALIGAHDGQTR